MYSYHICLENVLLSIPFYEWFLICMVPLLEHCSLVLVLLLSCTYSVLILGCWGDLSLWDLITVTTCLSCQLNIIFAVSECSMRWGFTVPVLNKRWWEDNYGCGLGRLLILSLLIGYRFYYNSDMVLSRIQSKHLILSPHWSYFKN